MVAKILRFILIWLALGMVMLVSWSLGFFLGNAITQSSPPPDNNPSAALAFLSVCMFNSLLVSILIWSTRVYPGRTRWIAIIIFCFTTQFFLTQMETYFFSKILGITVSQITGILISGCVMVVLTTTVGIVLMDKMFKTGARAPLKFESAGWSKLILPLILLASVAYPLIYLVFGYYVAWQNETLRIFYTQSSAINPFSTQLKDALFNGIYLFQILRGIIWVAVSVPVILMLQRIGLLQYLFVGFLSALPATLLLIPNPYMPAEVAITHFIETSASNFLWGVLITVVVGKYMTADTFNKRITTAG